MIPLSAEAFSEQQHAAQTMGLSEYLIKPIEMNKLLPVLTKYLRPAPSIAGDAQKRPSLPPLPDDRKKQLMEEFEALGGIPTYELESLLAQIRKIMALSEGFQSPYPRLLSQMKRAIAQGRNEAFHHLIAEALQRQTRDSSPPTP